MNKDIKVELIKHPTEQDWLWIRHELGQRIRIKNFLPEIVFLPDTSQEYGEKIDKLLDEIRED